MRLSDIGQIRSSHQVLVEERDSGDRRPRTLSNQAFATGMEACADRRLSDQAVAKGVEAFLDRLLAKQTFGEGFE